MSEQSSLPSYYRRNAVAFSCDTALFYMAMSFISGTTVLPTLMQTLTGSELIVGIASGVTSGAWLLPQLFIAGYATRLKRKLPFVCRVAVIYRPLLLVVAAAIWLFGESRPGITAGIVLVGLFLFYVFDAVAAVPWFDLMAKGLPAQRRGRVQGMAQVLGGVVGIGIGIFIRYALSASSPWAFPANYALLFAMSFLAMAISTAFTACIYEPAEDSAPGLEPKDEAPSTLRAIASLPRFARKDRPFLIMLAVRMALSFVAVATAFYVLYATGELGFGIEDVGLFISAQVAGQLAAGFVIGLVQDKWGPKAHIRVNCVTALLPPLLALVACATGVGPESHAWTYPLFMVLYFCMGLYLSSSGWPFINWIMEHADETRRPLYIGATNTLGAVSMLAPVAGGWLVNGIGYPAAFMAAAGFAAVSLVGTRWLRSTR